jgi:UDP:flavonoid glycosyltransferase YjiC (YdhE family)
VWGCWRHSPQRVIGLWPEWLYGPKPDWPPGAVVTGFIEYDGPSTREIQEHLEYAIPEDTDKRRPIVFTAGSWTVNMRDFFAAACEACEILNWPGLILTQEEEPLGKPLPRLVRHIRYAPFGKLLPRCAAIVHHGGIGTAARALKAGIPQILMPMAYDQRYNANRLVRLGVARAIERTDLTPQNLTAQLREILASTRASERCRHYAKKLETNTALEKTCDYIEALQ